MKTILISISCIAILVSCNRGISTEKVNSIDSLASKVDSSFNNFAAIDSSKAINSVTKFQEDVEYMKTELKDTIQKNMAFFIDKYYGLRKSMNYLKGQYSTVKEELEMSQQQLKNLKYDATNGLLDETQFDSYFTREKENARKVIASSKMIVNVYEVALKEFERMSPRIDSLINASKVEKENV